MSAQNVNAMLNETFSVIFKHRVLIDGFWFWWYVGVHICIFVSTWPLKNGFLITHCGKPLFFVQKILLEKSKKMFKLKYENSNQNWITIFFFYSCLNMSELVYSCLKWSKLVYSCLNTSKLVYSRFNVFLQCLICIKLLVLL